MSYQDTMILEDIASNDLEMTKDAIKNAKRYAFHDAIIASRFVGKCVQSTLDRLGVKIREGMLAKKVDKMLEKKHVKVEHRDKYQGEDAWKSGIYIYKDDVIAAFISQVMFERPSVLALKIEKEFSVITNAKV